MSKCFKFMFVRILVTCIKITMNLAVSTGRTDKVTRIHLIVFGRQEKGIIKEASHPPLLFRCSGSGCKFSAGDEGNITRGTIKKERKNTLKNQTYILFIELNPNTSNSKKKNRHFQYQYL